MVMEKTAKKIITPEMRAGAHLAGKTLRELGALALGSEMGAIGGFLAGGPALAPIGSLVGAWATTKREAFGEAFDKTALYFGEKAEKNPQVRKVLRVMEMEETEFVSKAKKKLKNIW